VSTPEEIVAIRMPGVTIDPLYFEWAEDRIPVCVPDGNTKNMMIALQTMHMYQVDQNNAGGSGGSGVVESEKEGDLSVTYSKVDGVYGDLNATPWGVELSGYLTAYKPSPMTRFSNSNEC
jgi:hypothetical protein